MVLNGSSFGESELPRPKQYDQRRPVRVGHLKLDSAIAFAVRFRAEAETFCLLSF